MSGAPRAETAADLSPKTRGAETGATIKGRRYDCSLDGGVADSTLADTRAAISKQGGFSSWATCTFLSGEDCAHLRERVIDAVKRGEMSRRAAARRYEISESVAIKWLERVERDGSREPVGHGGH